MKIAATVFGLSVVLAAAAAHAETIDLNCNNGIVIVPLHLDTAAGTITLEGMAYHVGYGSPKIPFSATDPAGDKIDYVLDRSVNILTETDHDHMPDGSFKTITLQFTCTKSAE
jgi:hypothetical protein